MSKKLFSKDDQLILGASPYVESVSEKSVIFTPELPSAEAGEQQTSLYTYIRGLKTS